MGKYLVNHYIVYDLDDNYVMEGTSEQICKKLDIVKSTVSRAVKNTSIVRRKYRIYEEENDIE